MLGQREQFGPGVADVEQGQAELARQVHQVAEQVAPQGGVEPGERLIEQQQARRGEQGAAQGHAPRLTARQVGDRALQQRLQAEQPDHLVGMEAAHRAWDAAVAEVQILLHGEVREQAVLLEQQADPALMGRGPPATLDIHQRGFVQLDKALVRAGQPGDGVQQGGLAAAGGAVQAGHLVVQGKIRAQGKSAVAQRAYHLQQGVCAHGVGLQRRVSAVLASRARAESSTETRTSRSRAAVWSPGVSTSE